MSIRTWIMGSWEETSQSDNHRYITQIILLQSQHEYWSGKTREVPYIELAVGYSNKSTFSLEGATISRLLPEGNQHRPTFQVPAVHRKMGYTYHWVHKITYTSSIVILSLYFLLVQLTTMSMNACATVRQRASFLASQHHELVNGRKGFCFLKQINLQRCTSKTQSHMQHQRFTSFSSSRPLQ